MMKSAGLRQRNHRPKIRRLHRLLAGVSFSSEKAKFEHAWVIQK
jgi:hypothetical protein